LLAALHLDEISSGMFTGIIHAVGSITATTRQQKGLRLRIDARPMSLQDVRLGDSIAVNGVCLTVVEFDEHSFAVDVSPETLACTTLGGVGVGSRVNLEPALRLGDRLGGHLVSGHVDGVGEILGLSEDGDCLRCRISMPAGLARYVARKGSVCVDGVSLTVNGIDANVFDVQIIPHTRSETLFGDYRTGSRVNIEVDLLARYLERLVPAAE
jgi:riboflavin synthase